MAHSSRLILIDGYNVIRADPLLLQVERRSLEEARRLLLSTLNSSPRLRHDNVTVVFDGTYEGRPYANSFRHGHITALFSARGQTADELIKARAQSTDRPADMVVVTNDVDLRRFCQARGCQVTGSQNLLAQLPGNTQPEKRPYEPDADDDFEPRGLSTTKKGNPRRRGKRNRAPRDYRF